jgi:hypothetical protein
MRWMRLVIRCETLFLPKGINQFLSDVNISRVADIFMAIILEFFCSLC